MGFVSEYFVKKTYDGERLLKLVISGDNLQQYKIKIYISVK